MTEFLFLTSFLLSFLWLWVMYELCDTENNHAQFSSNRPDLFSFIRIEQVYKYLKNNSLQNWKFLPLPFSNSKTKCMLAVSCLWKWEICKTWKQQNEIMWFAIFPLHFSAWKRKMPPPSAITTYSWFPSVKKVVEIYMGSLWVSDVHILISSSSFGIHLCLIFLEYYSGAKYYLPTLHISAFM